MPELRKVAIITGASQGIGAGPVAVLEAQRRFRPPSRRGAVRRHKPAAAVITHASHDQATTHHPGDEHAAYGSSTRPSAVSARTVSRQHESPNHQTRSCTCPSPTSASTPQGSHSVRGAWIQLTPRRASRSSTWRYIPRPIRKFDATLHVDQNSAELRGTVDVTSLVVKDENFQARRASNPAATPRPPAAAGDARLRSSPSKHDPRDEQQHAKNVKEERDVIHRRNPPRERSRWTDRPNSGTRAYGELCLRTHASCAPSHRRAGSRVRIS
jgi:hypothetical protein